MATQPLNEYTIHPYRIRNGVWVAVDPKGNLRYIYGKYEWSTKAACEKDIMRMYSAQLAFASIK